MNAKITRPINTPEEAKFAADKIVEQQEKINQSRKFEFEPYMKALSEASPETGGFDELATLLALPEEHFAVLAPVFLDELEKGLNNVSDKMLLVQTLNLSGLKVEQVRQLLIIHSPILRVQQKEQFLFQQNFVVKMQKCQHMPT